MSLEISFSQPPHYQSEAIPAPLSGPEYTVFENGLDASNFEYTFNTFNFFSSTGAQITHFVISFGIYHETYDCPNCELTQWD